MKENKPPVKKKRDGRKIRKRCEPSYTFLKTVPIDRFDMLHNYVSSRRPKNVSEVSFDERETETVLYVL